MELGRFLVVIPARAGSKGLPGKNSKMLCGKPLVAYTIEAALGVFSKAQICVSTDDPSVIDIAESYGLEVPFVRPSHLASDTASTQEVLIHAQQYYQSIGAPYDVICLLQPTSPFRNATHLRESLAQFFALAQKDMLVSVCESKANPYFNLMEEQANGMLVKSKAANFVTRQTVPKVYELNGAIYLISVASLLSKPIAQFETIAKYVMSKEDSIDIDDQKDWDYATYLIENGKQGH